jgi:hypothetical protein
MDNAGYPPSDTPIQMHHLCPLGRVRDAKTSAIGHDRTPWLKLRQSYRPPGPLPHQSASLSERSAGHVRLTGTPVCSALADALRTGSAAAAINSALGK